MITSCWFYLSSVVFLLMNLVYVTMLEQAFKRQGLSDEIFPSLNEILPLKLQTLNAVLAVFRLTVF